MATISWGDGRIGHLAQPQGDGPFPGIVVIHESLGLDDNIRALADRLAGMGQLTLAPDFYDGATWWRCVLGAFRQLRAGQGPFVDSIDAARAWLAGREDCTGKVGVVGFCLGGGFALVAAAQHDFAAAAVNYGELPKDADAFLRGACPVVASYGGRDRTLRGRPERLERALSAGDVPHDIKVYPDAGHSFMSVEPYSAGAHVIDRIAGMHLGAHEASAQDAWNRIAAFFGQYLR